MIRVVIVDDHELLTESLVRLINDDPEVQVVATESTALAGIDRITEERPDIVIMDYSLPDMDGASATKLLRQRVQDIAVIMLTGSERPGAYSAAMEAGCAAWVRKTHAAHELLEAIHRVAAGERVAIAENEELPALEDIVVHYQPVLELETSQVAGFEALVRWQHPERGLLTPAHFLPLAEATGYITDIDREVGTQACQELAEWQRLDTRHPPLWVSCNLSALGLSMETIATGSAAIVARAGIAPADLVVEITETALLEDTAQITENLAALKSVGVTLALDDFGTAFSSLSYLRRFPFDRVKIDTSFTAELPHTPRAVLLVEAIVQLADRMGAMAIAEGIERAEQATCLLQSGWRYGQGYLYSPAVPAERARQLARTRSL